MWFLEFSAIEVADPGTQADPSHFNANESTKDPRKKLIEQLKVDIGIHGNIVAYNATFEIDVLKKLAIAYPEDADFLIDLTNRFVDLLVVFRNGWYYKPEMKASASIKSVLPAIAPDFSYTDLTINNGGDASSLFLSMIKNEFTGNVIQTRKDLLKYCERDTLGMVILYFDLLKIINTENKTI